MKNGSVLNVYSVANTDGVNISTQHCIEPYAAITSHNDVAYKSRVIGKVTVLADLRGKPSY